jgi:nucleotide-binding universal stress UspA family protein
MAGAAGDATILSMKTAATRGHTGWTPKHSIVTRIAVGMDGFPEGEDAAALAAALAQVSGADVMLVAVQPDPLILPPLGLSWKTAHKESEAMLQHARASVAPGARVLVETDFSVARALHRVVEREHRNLLVMGSSRRGAEGRVRIGKRTRQLLCHFECPLAIAPRGFSQRGLAAFSRIGVGYDGGQEAETALELGGSLAVAAGAELEVDAVVDDRVPPIGWSLFAVGGAEYQQWEDAILAETARRRADTERAASVAVPGATVEIKRGRPADALLALSEKVDLLVIGSRRWGPASRVLLGSTGEALLHDAACPVVVVPRPAA